MRALPLALALALSLAAAPARGQEDWYQGAYQQCANLDTAGIVDCVDRLTRPWAARLDTAYKEVETRLTPARRTAFGEVQRLWLAYREASCRYYGAGEGSIARVEAAECLRVITAARARELELMLRP